MTEITYTRADKVDMGMASNGPVPEPVSALQDLIDLIEHGPLDDPTAHPEIYAAIFFAKVAASAWKRKA